jgi:hypothetical protein
MSNRRERGGAVAWVILLIALAILLGVVGFILKILKWVLIIVVLLFIAGLVAGLRSR